MRTRIISVASLIAGSIFLIPLAAQAIFYAPGETLNPACAPTDPTCGVTTPFTLFQNGNIGIGTLVPAARLDVTGTNSTAVIGPEMIVATADQDFSSDSGKWTGTNWTIGAGVDTHTAGANVLTLDNTALSSIPVAGNIYQITFSITTTVAGTITPNIGGVSGVAVGQGLVATTQTQVIIASGAGALTFTPNATWTGTIDNVSVKQITPSSATQIIRNSDGSIGLEIRAGAPFGGTANTFIGISAGQSNVNSGSTGFVNTAIGASALQSNTVGTFNTAVGGISMQNNTTGIDNTAVGGSSLFANTTGSFNAAVGFQALRKNTTGTFNTGTGANTLQANTTGNDNTATGNSALIFNTTGTDNTATGFHALLNNTTGNSNIANGSIALFANTAGINNVAMGVSALSNNTTGANNTAIGDNSLPSNTTGSNNTAIGLNTFLNNTLATSSTAVGYQAGQGTAPYSNQGGVYVGYQSGNNAGTGSDYNTFIGYESGFGVTTGKNNIWLGTATSSQAIANLTTGSQNILIGNNISIPSATASGQLDIGNILYGTGITGTGLTLSTGSIGIGTSTPAQKLDVNGTIRQTGCINGALSSNASGDIICTSDLAYKQNVTPFTSGLSAIEGITPQYFQYKGESFTHAGFIAQNVQTVLPDAVSQQANGSLGLDTNAILAAAVNAIKELDTRINGGVPTAIATAQSSLQSLANNIGQTASALTSDAFTQIASWLADAGNGIKKISAESLCVRNNTGETCVTRDELDALIASVHIPAPTPAITEPALETATSTSTTTESVIAPEIPPEATSTPLLPNTGARTLFNRTLDIGSSGADVAALQTILMQKGYLYLPVGMMTGYFGELTRDAVMKYQSSVGLEPIGIVGPQTRAMLNR